MVDKTNKCCICKSEIKNAIEGKDFILWPNSKAINKLCKECARKHLTDEAFENYFGEKRYKLPVKMTRRSCWEPERFADVAVAKTEWAYQSLKKDGYIVCYE